MEDVISAHRIIEELEMETPSPVILHKPQGFIDSSFPNLAFLLVLMTRLSSISV